ncbi:MAG: beta-propeller domain-containing protein, partial [Candidatus Gracilibacteria bacterium]
MKLKNFLFGMIAAVLSFNTVAFALEPVNLFLDVKQDDKYGDAIKYLKEEGVVQGYSDGTYAPGNRITRAEFLKILIEVSDYKPEGENCFKDVKQQWFAPYVCKAKEQGFVTGYSNGNFAPAADINLAEAAKMISEVLDVEIDSDKDDNWYHKYISALGGLRALPPEFDSFNDTISRGQMAEMMWRVKESISSRDYTTYTRIKDAGEMVASAGKSSFKRFSSCSALDEYVKDNSRGSSYLMKNMAEGAPMSVSDDATGAEQGLGASEYSSTNVQVAGVDEADIIKNDGSYIYLVKGGTVRIVEAYPLTGMKEVKQITFSDDNFYPKELYLDGNELVVIGESYGYSLFNDYIKKNFKEAPYYGGSETKMYIYDISDKAAPKLDRRVVFEGNYISSRKVDNMVYVVANKPNYGDYPVPLYEDSSENEVKSISKCTDIGYIPGSERADYLIVGGVNIDDSDSDVLKQVVVGGSENIYASKDNLYVVERLYNYGWRGWIYDENSQNDDKSVIYKFSLGEDEIGFEGTGEVPGHVLNQFSMDEYSGNFRVATTVGEVWNEGQKSKNNLYILDDDLKIVGKIEDLAPGEKIYSARFIGKRVYMVTFKKVDPLFVIDLSVPDKPKVLGYLKIPGYSDYLHPYDENHIIAIGKDAADASSEEVANRFLDFAWYQG